MEPPESPPKPETESQLESSDSHTSASHDPIGFDRLYRSIGLYRSHFDWIRSQEALRGVSDEVLEILARYREGLGKGKLLEWLTPADGDRILDNGCGVGYFIFDIAARHPTARLTFAGLEVSASALALLRKRCAIEGNARVLALLGSILSLPFPDASFHAVVCSEVLDHTPDAGLAIREMARVLRPGGKLLVTVPNGPAELFWDGLRARSRRWAGQTEAAEPYFETHLELRDIRRWVTEAGLVLRHEELNTALPVGTLVRRAPRALQLSFARLLVAIEPLLRFQRLATNYVFMAEKAGRAESRTRDR